MSNVVILAQNTKEALVWITTIMKQHNIPFQIAGGLAVQAYGSKRALMDIDIDIPEEAFAIVQKEVAPYITFGPARFKSESWDLFLMTLNYHGQEIDLSGAYDTKIYDQNTCQWIRLSTDFSKVNHMQIDGLTLPIIDLKDLIAYKKMLLRPVDLLDIQFLDTLGRCP